MNFNNCGVIVQVQVQYMYIYYYKYILLYEGIYNNKSLFCHIEFEATNDDNKSNLMKIEIAPAECSSYNSYPVTPKSLNDPEVSDMLYHFYVLYDLVTKPNYFLTIHSGGGRRVTTSLETP